MSNNITRVEQVYEETKQHILRVMTNMYKAIHNDEYDASEFVSAIEYLKKRFQKLEAYRILNDIRTEELYVIDKQGHIVPIKFS